jgi:hypothetical protein
MVDHDSGNACHESSTLGLQVLSHLQPFQIKASRYVGRVCGRVNFVNFVDFDSFRRRFLAEPELALANLQGFDSGIKGSWKCTDVGTKLRDDEDGGAVSEWKLQRD